jgi:nitroreductase
MVRVPDHPVDPLFPRRWSARAMSGAPVPRETLLSLLEAARWAPSGGNGQPWRFVFALRDGPAFASFLDALSPGNREWCARAGALVLLAAQTVRPDGKPSGSARFECGLACMAFLLQGTSLGLVVHPMGGFDRERIAAVAAIEGAMEPQAMIAVGQPGPRELLGERDRAREEPSGRRPIAEWAREDRWA